MYYIVISKVTNIYKDIQGVHYCKGMEAPLSNSPAHPDFEVGLSSIYVNGLERSYLFLESAVESLGKLK